MKDLKDLQQQLSDSEYKLKLLLDDAHHILQESVSLPQTECSGKLNATIQNTIDLVSDAQSGVVNILRIADIFESNHFAIELLTKDAEYMKALAEAVDLALKVNRDDGIKMWQEGLKNRAKINFFPTESKGGSDDSKV